MSKFAVKGIPIPSPYIHKKGYRIGNIYNNLDHSSMADYSPELFFIRREEVSVSLPLMQTGYVLNNNDVALSFDKYAIKPIDAGVQIFYCTSASMATWESPDKMPEKGVGTKDKPFTNLAYAIEKVSCIYKMMDESVCCNGVKIIVDGTVDYPFDFSSDIYSANFERPFIFDVSAAYFSIGTKQPKFMWKFPRESYVEGLNLKVYLDSTNLSIGDCVFLNCEFDVSGTSDNDTKFNLSGTHLYDAVINIKNCNSNIDFANYAFFRKLQDGSVIIYGCGIYNTSIKGNFLKNQEQSSMYISGDIIYVVNIEADCIKTHAGFSCRGDYGYNVTVKLVAESHFSQGSRATFFEYAENVSLNFNNLLYNGNTYGLLLGTGINCHSTVKCGVNSHSYGMGVHIGKNCTSSISYNDYEYKIKDMCTGSECEQNMCYTRICPDGTRFLINSYAQQICAYDDDTNPVLYNCKATQPSVLYATWIKEGWKPSIPDEYFESGTIVKMAQSNNLCYVKVD